MKSIILNLKIKIVSKIKKNKILETIYNNYTIFWKNILKNKYSLEIHVADHCNLNCYGCTHYSPLLEKSFIDNTSLEEDLKHIEKINRSFSEIRILGGEPFLNKDLAKIVEKIRKTFPVSIINIVTNGTLITKMDIEFWNIIKKNNVGLKITQYPNVNLIHAKEILELYNINYSIYADSNYTWYLYRISDDNKGIVKNFIKCSGHHLCWQLKNGKIYTCPIHAYSGILNKKFNTNFQHYDCNFLNVNEKLNRYKLFKFALTPKKFCRYCILPLTETNWQHSKKDITEWVKIKASMK